MVKNVRMNVEQPSQGDSRTQEPFHLCMLWLKETKAAPTSSPAKQNCQSEEDQSPDVGHFPHRSHSRGRKTMADPEEV